MATGLSPAPGRLRSLLLGTGALMLAVGATCPAIADVNITPAATVQVIGTDNLRKQPSNEESDAVLQSEAAVQISADTLKLKFLGSPSLMYDAFAENSDLNELTGEVLANAIVTVVPEFLTLDGSAQISDEFLNVLDQSATGLPNGGPQSRITNLQAGAAVSTKLGDVADVKLRGSVATVQSEPIGGAPSTAALQDAVSYSGSVLITNGDRSRNAVWQVRASVLREHRADSQDFQSADAVASVTVKVTPRIHAVMRGGYEDISGIGLSDISDTVWGAGFMYDIGNSSRVTAEWGHRFGRDSWSGDMDIQLSDRMGLSASYSERIESQQERLSRQLGDLFAEANSLPTPSLPGSTTPGQNLIDDTFYVKDALLSIDFTGLSRTFSLTGRYNDREFTSLPQGDTTAGLTFSYSEVLLKDLVFGLSGSYDTVLDSTVGSTTGDRLVGSGLLSFKLGANASANLQYTWSKTSAIVEVTENVASAAITHSF